MVKEDGTTAQAEEKIAFKVIEFNKDAKRIILSHSRIHEDESKGETKGESKSSAAPKKAAGAKKATKKEETETTSSTKMEKTTLGDLEALSALKEKLDNK